MNRGRTPCCWVVLAAYTAAATTASPVETALAECVLKLLHAQYVHSRPTKRINFRRQYQIPTQTCTFSAPCAGIVFQPVARTHIQLKLPARHAR